MRKSYSFLIAATVIALAACTSYAEKLNKTEITSQQLETAKKRWSGVTEDNLKSGKTIFTQKCTECHKAFVIEKFSEKKWNHEIDDMSPKAKLTASEKQDLTYFILSYLDMKQISK